MLYFKRIKSDLQDFVVMVDSELSPLDIEEKLGSEVNSRNILSKIAEISNSSEDSILYRKAKIYGISFHDDKLYWIDYKEYVAMSKMFGDKFEEFPIAIDEDLDVSEYTVGKEIDGIGLSHFGFFAHFALFYNSEKRMTLPMSDFSTSKKIVPNGGETVSTDAKTVLDKKNYFRKVSTDSGDFVIIYSVTGPSFKKNEQQKTRFNFLEEDFQYSLSEEKTKEIVSLIVNSGADISFNEDISWIRYEDYVRYMTSLRLVNPYVPTPIEIAHDIVIKPTISASESANVDKLFNMINDPNKFEVLPSINLSALEFKKYHKSGAPSGTDEEVLGVAKEPSNEEKIESLKTQVEEAQLVGNYQLAAELKQQLAILEASLSAPAGEQKDEDLTLEEKIKVLESKIREAQKVENYQLAAELKQQEAGDLQAIIEEAQRKGDYEKAAIYKQRLAILIGQATKDKEIEPEIDYESIKTGINHELEKAVLELDYQRVGELRQQLAILDFAQNLDGLSYEKKVLLFDEKIRESEERADYAARTIWIQLLNVLQKSKNHDIPLEEADRGIDYDAIANNLNAQLQEILDGLKINVDLNTEQKIIELKKQLEIIKFAKEHDAMDYDAKYELFAEKLKEAEEENDFVSRSTWLQLINLLEETKKKQI